MKTIGNLLDANSTGIPFELRVVLGMEPGMTIVDKFGFNLFNHCCFYILLALYYG